MQICLCRRKQREQKRYAKQVMAERVKEKVQAKKAGVASITKLRKQRQRDGFAGELDMDAELAGPGQGRKPAMTPGQRIRPGTPWRWILLKRCWAVAYHGNMLMWWVLYAQLLIYQGAHLCHYQLTRCRTVVGSSPFVDGLLMRNAATGERTVGKKREAKNEKYGFGGRKRLGKQNDASSAADMDGFRQGRFDDGFGGR